VVDIEIERDGLQNIALTLDFLSKVSNYEEVKVLLRSKIEALELTYLVKKPKLVSCNHICKVLCK